jgi:phosphatidylglycerophosphatase A
MKDSKNSSASGKRWNLCHPAIFLATGFGVGFLPRAPGTWGSILAVFLSWGIVHMWGHIALAIGIILSFSAGVWSSGFCIRNSGIEDPKQVVIDEISGQWLVLIFVPLDALNYAMAFVLFRFFDILKPWPIGWVDRTVKGGAGVMVDDILAAIYAIPILYGMIIWIGN